MKPLPGEVFFIDASRFATELHWESFYRVSRFVTPSPYKSDLKARRGERREGQTKQRPRAYMYWRCRRLANLLPEQRLGMLWLLWGWRRGGRYSPLFSKKCVEMEKPTPCQQRKQNGSMRNQGGLLGTPKSPGSFQGVRNVSFPAIKNPNQNSWLGSSNVIQLLPSLVYHILKSFASESFLGREKCQDPFQGVVNVAILKRKTKYYLPFH